MSINPDRQGHIYAPTAPFQVSREAITEFAQAVKADHAAHYDVAVAQQLGHSDVIAPPTYAVVIAQRAEAQAVQDPETGIDFSRVVHADERFTHEAPITAGDTLRAQTTLERIRTMGAGAMVTTRTEITAEGEPRATVTSSLLVRTEDDAEETAA